MADDTGTGDSEREFRLRMAIKAMSASKVDIGKLTSQLAETHNRFKDPFFDCRLTPDRMRLWSRMTYWTVQECTLLSHGADPDRVDETVRSKMFGPVATEYRDHLRLAERAQDVGELEKQVRPLEYIDWAKSNGTPISEELEKLVRGRVTAVDDAGDKELHPKERISLLKIIACLARDKYGPNIVVRPNEYFKKIHGAQGDHGLSLDLDTVRKWVREAIEENKDRMIEADKKRSG